jgi:hypothetical protein
MGGAGSTLASVGVSLRFLTSKLVARGTMEDVVVMSGSSVTCFTSSGGGGGNAGDVTSVGASGSGVSASIPAGAGATGLAICCGMSSGGCAVACFATSGLAGSLAGSAGGASTFGWAEVVAGSARCFGKIGEGCTTSTSIAGGALRDQHREHGRNTESVHGSGAKHAEWESNRAFVSQRAQLQGRRRTSAPNFRI